MSLELTAPHSCSVHDSLSLYCAPYSYPGPLQFCGWAAIDRFERSLHLPARSHHQCLYLHLVTKESYIGGGFLLIRLDCFQRAVLEVHQLGHRCRHCRAWSDRVSFRAESYRWSGALLGPKRYLSCDLASFSFQLNESWLQTALFQSSQLPPSPLWKIFSICAPVTNLWMIEVKQRTCSYCPSTWRRSLPCPSLQALLSSHLRSTQCSADPHSQAGGRSQTG